MKVSLRLLRKDGAEPAMPEERALEAERITIRRKVDCALVLDDPKKRVSRVHAELTEAEGANPSSGRGCSGYCVETSGHGL